MPEQHATRGQRDGGERPRRMCGYFSPLGWRCAALAGNVLVWLPLVIRKVQPVRRGQEFECPRVLPDVVQEDMHGHPCPGLDKLQRRDVKVCRQPREACGVPATG
jgi:hypothetical protein